MKLINILATILEDRKVIDKWRGTVVQGTGYKPHLGYKALVTLFEKNGLIVRHHKAKTTTSYYIEVESPELDSKGWPIRSAEIRLSNHTRRIDTYSYNDINNSSYVYQSNDSEMEVNIIDKQGYIDGKKALQKHFNI